MDTSPVTLDTFLVQDTTHNDSNRERSTSPWVGLPVILFAFVWPPRVWLGDWPSSIKDHLWPQIKAIHSHYWVLRLQPYNYIVHYITSRDNIEDVSWLTLKCVKWTCCRLKTCVFQFHCRQSLWPWRLRKLKKFCLTAKHLHTSLWRLVTGVRLQKPFP